MATRFFLAIHDFLVRHRLLAWLVLAFVLGLCLWSGLRLGYKEDVTEFLPTDGEGARYTALYSAMGEQGEVTVIFRLSDTTVAADEGQMLIEEAIDAFGDEWLSRHSGDTADYRLRCRADDIGANAAVDYIRQNIAIYLTPADYRRIDSLLAIEGYVDS